ncbi:MAG: hypothetical protein V7L00_27655 [Nostoc sp.]|uniref:hypothetical protein n=1 Tax=Nostoc sp. TaxID=1180 RepID=UPI002FFA690E
MGQIPKLPHISVAKRFTSGSTDCLANQYGVNCQTLKHFLSCESKLVCTNLSFLTPSIQSIAAHMSPVEQICHLHILKLQHHASTAWRK